MGDSGLIAKLIVESSPFEMTTKVDFADVK